MKLAEALQERADIQKRLAQLKGRLRHNARVQEGEDRKSTRLNSSHAT